VRGLARSRTHAAKLIADGLVTVNGAAQLKPSFRVPSGAAIILAGVDHYVSRGAHKLLAALDAFGVDPTGRITLDAGASTGGFTQVLLERGAAQVLAIDVGHDQLAQPLRHNPAVTSVEGFNIRELSREWVSEKCGGQLPSLAVADVSFISLGLVLGPLRGSVARNSDLILLVKPQFEVGRTGIREGIVREVGARHEAVMNVLWSAWDLGLGTAGVIASPIAGGAGNREYLVWLNASTGTNPTNYRAAVGALG
jgi:23S rRNA (cytidine1920-2'-O)/16S rRNA (cytidine1409-2'-O)-methyltransferase